MTDPKDVARVESQTFMVTKEKGETTPEPAEGVKGTLAQWMSPEKYEGEFNDRFPGCMKGTVFVRISLIEMNYHVIGLDALREVTELLFGCVML